MGGLPDVVRYDLTTNRNGTVQIDGSMVTFQGVAAIADELLALDRTFAAGHAGPRAVRITDDADSTNGLSQIEVGFPGDQLPISFASPTNVLTVATTDASDLIEVRHVDPAFTGLFALHGGMGNDTYALEAGNAVVRDSGGEDTVEFSAAADPAALHLDLVNASQTVNSSLTLTLEAEIGAMAPIENVTGTRFDDVFYVDAVTAPRTILGAGNVSNLPGDTIRFDALKHIVTRDENTVLADGFALLSHGGVETVEIVNAARIDTPDEGDGQPGSEVVSSFSVQYANTRFNRRTGEQITDVIVTNTSDTDYASPLQLVVDAISHPDVTLRGASGKTPDGNSYFERSGHLGADDVLSPGESSAPVPIIFYNPRRVRFNFEAHLDALFANPNALAGALEAV